MISAGNGRRRIQGLFVFQWLLGMQVEFSEASGCMARARYVHVVISKTRRESQSKKHSYNRRVQSRVKIVELELEVKTLAQKRKKFSSVLFKRVIHDITQCYISDPFVSFIYLNPNGILELTYPLCNFFRGLLSGCRKFSIENKLKFLT